MKKPERTLVRPPASVSVVTCPAVYEWLYSLAVGVRLLVDRIDTRNAVRFGLAWLALGIVTAIARYAGDMTRRECRDLRFLFYSLHGKIPMWINWLFWLVLAVLLIRPFFALSVYIAAGLAFYRGYRFPRPESSYWKITSMDIIIRCAGGFLL